MKQPKSSAADGVRQQVNRLLSKLSDRDTETSAAAELDAVALSLPHDSLPAFLAAISDLRPSDKPPLRRHPLRLLSLLASRQNPQPLLPRMLHSALRRLRDPDSSVRSALVSAVRSISAASPGGAALLRPVADALFQEQEPNSQSAAALCLAAAVESSVQSPELADYLRRLLPRLVKLLRSSAFKAKPALISAVGAIAEAGGASEESLLGILVPCLVEFLASEDWAARKAATEALYQVAVAERDLLGGFRNSCISSFEPRRFDKVKIVRDSMNRMLEVWKDIPEAQSNSNLKGTGSDARFPIASKSSASARSVSPFVGRKSRFPESRSPPPNPSPVARTRRSTTPSRENRSNRPLFRKTDVNNSEWGIEVSVPRTLPFTDEDGEKLLKSDEQSREGVKSNSRSNLEVKRMPFEKNCEDKGSKLGGSRLDSRVVPLNEAGSSELTAGGGGGATHELHGNQKDRDLALIRRQLVQIESQQSNLVDLLQRFIGSSQNGISSLETRVHGLEMALNEISRDLATSSERLLNNDPAVNKCCALPGAEFLTSKFWRRTEGGYPSGLPALADSPISIGRQGQGSRRLRPRLQGGFVVNPLAEINPESRGNAEIAPLVKY